MFPFSRLVGLWDRFLGGGISTTYIQWGCPIPPSLNNTTPESWAPVRQVHHNERHIRITSWPTAWWFERLRKEKQIANWWFGIRIGCSQGTHPFHVWGSNRNTKLPNPANHQLTAKEKQKKNRKLESFLLDNPPRKYQLTTRILGHFE